MNQTNAMQSVLDVEFASVDGVSLQLDVHLPTHVNNPPLVVWIHGGGWQQGDKEACRIKYLTEFGYAVASINYRLTDKACFPAQIHDCKAAIRFLRANSDRFAYTVDKLVVAGGSAGGHLASLLGTTNGDAWLEGTLGDHLDASSSVDGVLDFYGPTDFILRAKTHPQRVLPVGSLVFKLLGGRADELVDLAKQASPAWQVDANTVPFIIFQGDADEAVLMDQPESLMAALRKYDIPHSYHIGSGFVHSDQRFYEDPYRKPALNFIREIYGH